MPPIILDIVVDEQGRPVRKRTAETVEQDIPVGGGILSPAESIPVQDVMQKAARAVASLNAQAAAAFQCLSLTQAPTDFQHLRDVTGFLIEQTTVAQAPAALLTTNTQFQKMCSAIAEEKTRFQQFQNELWTPALPLIESRWKEDQARLRGMRDGIAATIRALAGAAPALINPAPPAWLAAMSTAQPLIALRWTEDQEQLQKLVAPFQTIQARLQQAAFREELQTSRDIGAVMDDARRYAIAGDHVPMASRTAAELDAKIAALAGHRGLAIVLRACYEAERARRQAHTEESPA